MGGTEERRENSYFCRASSSCRRVHMDTWAANCCSCTPLPACGAALKKSIPDHCTEFQLSQSHSIHASVIGKRSVKVASMFHGELSRRSETKSSGFLKCLSREPLKTSVVELNLHGGRKCTWKNGLCQIVEISKNAANAHSSRSDVASQAVASDTNCGRDAQRDLSNVRIILVEPRGALNVGMVARSMANFGLNHLVLVNPQGEAADYQGEEACRMACHAVPILEGATVAPTLAAALAGVTRAVATTARQRAPPAPPLEILGSRTVGGCLDFLLDANAGCSALIFGREDSGLTNDELSFAQRTLMIPSSPAYSSLNLSHAVTVVCYELSQQARSHRASEGVPCVPDDASTSSILQDDVSVSRDDSATGRHQEPGAFTPASENDPGLDPDPWLGVQAQANIITSMAARESAVPENPEPSTSGKSGESGLDKPKSVQTESEGPVELSDGPGRPGGRKTRRLDRALKRTDVADGADVDGALKQAEDLLTKMGFLKGDTRNAKVPKLRQLLVRASPTNSEVALLRAIFRRMDWHVTKAQENDQQ